jgi:photosystem II stability/assembly factor-like uncharacterized protein
MVSGCAKPHVAEEEAEDSHYVEEVHHEISKKHIAYTPDWIYDIAIHPVKSNIIYVATPSGVYRSIDGGKFWHEISHGLVNPNITAIEINPKQPNIVYIGGDSGVFMNEDEKNIRWCEMNNGLTNPLVRVLAIDPNDTNIIYAGCIGTGGLFKSNNGGELWVKVDMDLPINIQVTCISIDRNSNVYIGSWGDGVFKSKDRGRTWMRKNTGLETLNIRAIAINPIFPDIVYVGTPYGVYGSINGGDTWKRLTKTPMPPEIWTIAINPATTNMIYIGAWLSGVLYSFDFGENWEKRNQGLVDTCIHCIAIDPNNPDIIYAGTEKGIHKSINAGITWKLQKNFGKMTHPETDVLFIEEDEV